MTVSQKLGVLLKIARIVNTMHNLNPPICHGNLNTQNIFIEVKQEDEDSTPEYLIRLGEIEMADFKKYANLFYSYRSTSVSSAPENLKNQRQRNDPTT